MRSPIIDDIRALTRMVVDANVRVQGFRALRIDTSKTEALRKLRRYRCQSRAETQIRADYLALIIPIG